MDDGALITHECRALSDAMISDFVDVIGGALGHGTDSSWGPDRAKKWARAAAWLARQCQLRGIRSDHIDVMYGNIAAVKR